jgi:hypothetical protein
MIVTLWPRVSNSSRTSLRRSVGTLSAQYFAMRTRSVSGSFTVVTTHSWWSSQPAQ